MVIVTLHFLLFLLYLKITMCVNSNPVHERRYPYGIRGRIGEREIQLYRLDSQ